MVRSVKGAKVCWGLLDRCNVRESSPGFAGLRDEYQLTCGCEIKRDLVHVGLQAADRNGLGTVSHIALHEAEFEPDLAFELGQCSAATRFMFLICSDRRTLRLQPDSSFPQNHMSALHLHDLPFEIVPLDARLMLCSTPAGFPSPAADDIEEPIDLGTWLIEQPAASYVMRVDGISMAGAGINDGDLIVVSRAKKPRPGHIVVALVHGDRTLKRLKRAGDRLWLIAEAEGYGETIVDENVEIWGVVVGLARRY